MDRSALRIDLVRISAVAALFALTLAPTASAQPWINQNQMQELVASDHAPGRSFGAAVAISGSTILAGSPGLAPGAAYVFQRVGSSFVEVQKLFSPAPVVGDGFGAGLALSNSLAVVGRVNPSRAGYAFAFDGASWNAIQTIPTPPGVSEVWEAPVLSGPVLAVPAYVTAVGPSTSVYRFNGAAFAFEASIAAPIGTSVSAVAVSGDALLVGLNRSAGVETAEVYRWNGASWDFEAEFSAPDGPAERAFGAAVALATDVALVGAPADASTTGAAYVFRRSAGVWGFEQKLVGISGDQFGTSVAFGTANAVLVGAPGADTANTVEGRDVGAIYHFRRMGSVWSPRAKLVASNGTFYSQFGLSVAASSTVAVTGAPGSCTDPDEDCLFLANEGSAYLFDVTPPACGIGAELVFALALLGHRRATRLG